MAAFTRNSKYMNEEIASDVAENPALYGLAAAGRDVETITSIVDILATISNFLRLTIQI
jgi:hypothetical protein